MPDISMCVNQECAVKNSCYRFTATPSDYQSYGDFSIETSGEGLKEGSCSYYWGKVITSDDEDN